MKKKVFFLGSVLAILFLSGCSLGVLGTKSSGEEKFVFSKTLWLSRDGGKNWEVSNSLKEKPPISDPNPLLLVFDNQDENTAYLGLLKGGIMKTNDGGVSWEFLNLKSNKIYGLALDPKDSKVIYSSALIRERGKILKSLDGGEKWEEIFTFPSNGPLVVSLAVDRFNSQIVYAATSDKQLIKSIDGGASWKNIFQPASPVVKIAMDNGDTRKVYLLTSDGKVYFSQNSGDVFEDLGKKLAEGGLPSSGYQVLEVDPSHPDWFYLGGNMGIFRTKNGGVVWEKIVVLNNPSSAPVTALAINPIDSREMIYGAAQATFRSTDDGKNWTPSQFEIAKSIRILKYNPLNPAVVYAGFMSK